MPNSSCLTWISKGKDELLYKKILDPDMTKLRAAIKSILPSAIKIR